MASLTVVFAHSTCLGERVLTFWFIHLLNPQISLYKPLRGIISDLSTQKGTNMIVYIASFMASQKTSIQRECVGSMCELAQVCLLETKIPKRRSLPSNTWADSPLLSGPLTVAWHYVELTG